MPLSLAAMQALFNDNAAGDISAQDGRDVIEGLYLWGAPAFADVSSTAVSVNNTADQTIWTQNVTVAAGDILFVETWGRGNNATGGARAWTFTLDFDGVFDMEWAWTAGAVDQAWRMEARLSVVATNFAAYELEAVTNDQGSGVLDNTITRLLGYETSTTDLTGTVTVSLVGRSDAATGTQDVYPYGAVIRRVPST